MQSCIHFYSICYNVLLSNMLPPSWRCVLMLNETPIFYFIYHILFDLLRIHSNQGIISRTLPARTLFTIAGIPPHLPNYFQGVIFLVMRPLPRKPNIILSHSRFTLLICQNFESAGNFIAVEGQKI